MQSKNTICLWFDNDAQEAARFYAATFPDSKVRAIHKAPADYPGGKEGDVLTVDFTVAFGSSALGETRCDAAASFNAKPQTSMTSPGSRNF